VRGIFIFKYKMNILDIKSFILNWHNNIRYDLNNIDFEKLTKIMEDFCFFILDKDVLKLIENFEFPKSLYKKSNLVNIENIKIGGYEQEKKNNIIIQSMAITGLNRVDKLFDEFCSLADSGSQMIRFAITGISDAKNVEILYNKLQNTKYSSIPMIMCGQYNVFPVISQTNILHYISKLRINPGNISLHSNNIDNFKNTLEYLVKFNQNINNINQSNKKIAIRIGVNWGSLDENFKKMVIDINSKNNFKADSKKLEVCALVMSVLFSSLYAEMLGFDKNLIIVSCKSSDPEILYLSSKLIRLFSDYPIHLGLTEAGSGDDGIVISSAALSPILRDGIGETIRVSITPKINESRTKEVFIAKKILSSLGLLFDKPKIISCPGCGRTDSDYFRILAEDSKKFIEENIEKWCLKYQNDKIRSINIAVMGCLVNGLGEMGHANIGISLPGFREQNSCLVYLDGKKHTVLKGENIKNDFFQIIEEYIYNYSVLKK